jgi:hypothetical protein
MTPALLISLYAFVGVQYLHENVTTASFSQNLVF